jgi:hypothetical protein
MKEKREFVEETMEQKQARWEKQSKSAKSFAKQCGVSLKKIAKERKRIDAEKRAMSRTRFY